MISNKTLFQTLIGIFLGVVTISIMLIAINSTISCVDKNGCLRSWCDYEWLRVEHQLALKKLNKICTFQNTSGEYSVTNDDLELYLKN
jgi:hypothetical protein